MGDLLADMVFFLDVLSGMVVHHSCGALILGSQRASVTPEG
jgi:hypothetical protein